jgi:hypothetical protein
MFKSVISLPKGRRLFVISFLKEVLSIMPSSFLDHCPTLYKLGIGKGKFSFSPLCPFIFLSSISSCSSLRWTNTYISTFTFLNNTSLMFFFLQFCYVTQVVIIHKYIKWNSMILKKYCCYPNTIGSMNYTNFGCLMDIKKYVF